MLSRVADSIYWMNRYMERAENVARFVDVNLYLTLDMPGFEGEQWEPIIATTGDTELFRKRYGEATRENVMRFLVFDREYPNSIISCLRWARENARSVREVISSEMWEQINRAFLQVRDAAQTPELVLEAPHEFFTSVKQAAQLFLGITYLTMSHNEAWHFGRLGRLIERADKTSRIVDTKYFLLLPDPSYVGSALDEIQWGALLKSASAFEMYRKRFGRVAPAQVAEFLLFDPTFPRAVYYCVRKADRSLHAITGTSAEAMTNPAERALGTLREELSRGDIQAVMARGMHGYLDDFQTRLNTVGEAIDETFVRVESSPSAAAT